MTQWVRQAGERRDVVESVEGLCHVVAFLSLGCLLLPGMADAVQAQGRGCLRCQAYSPATSISVQIFSEANYLSAYGLAAVDLEVARN